MLARHAPPLLRGGAVYRCRYTGRRTIDDHYFWPRVVRKGSSSGFELVEKGSFLVDVDFIGPILTKAGKSSVSLLGR